MWKPYLCQTQEWRQRSITSTQNTLNWLSLDWSHTFFRILSLAPCSTLLLSIRITSTQNKSCLAFLGEKLGLKQKLWQPKKMGWLLMAQRYSDYFFSLLVLDDAALCWAFYHWSTAIREWSINWIIVTRNLHTHMLSHVHIEPNVPPFVWVIGNVWVKLILNKIDAKKIYFIKKTFVFGDVIVKLTLKKMKLKRCFNGRKKINFMHKILI